MADGIVPSIPKADTSSFMETLIPLRALALFAKISGDTKAKVAAEHAAEVFLTRQLFKRRSDGQVINHRLSCSITRAIGIMISFSA